MPASKHSSVKQPSLLKFSSAYSWTTIVVHSRDVEDCGGAPRRKSTLKPVKIPYITIWQYWLGNILSPKKLSD